MDFKDEKQFGDDWLVVMGKFVIILGILMVIAMFARHCERQEARRVKLGGVIELGDSTWGDSK